MIDCALTSGEILGIWPVKTSLCDYREKGQRGEKMREDIYCAVYMSNRRLTPDRKLYLKHKSDVLWDLKPIQGLCFLLDEASHARGHGMQK